MSFSSTHRRAGRARRAASFLALTVLGGAAAGVAGGLSAPPAAASPRRAAAASRPADLFPGGLVHLAGHGFGPGVGMGQWGAFGYAVEYHERYRWILRHYYSGTRIETMSRSNPVVSVAIIENDQSPVVVTSTSRFRVGTHRFQPGTAARAVMDPSAGTWTLSEATTCTAGASAWKQVATGLSDPLFIPSSQQPGAPAAELLTICRADGVDETVRGLVRAFTYESAATGNRPYAETLNLLRLDQYLADVVPSESSWGWGEIGTSGSPPQHEPWGFQELEAQAVAARTYVLAYIAAGGWNGAGICDSDYCQSYPGIANEAAISTAAVADTEGQYLAEHGAAPAETEYSASTGGWTAPSQFAAVQDLGDSVCIQSSYWTCNPGHFWNVTVEVSAVEATFPAIGTLRVVRVTKRNGLGAWGGRAITVQILGTRGSVNESGDAFEQQFGLDSNWFVITHPKVSSPAAGQSSARPAFPLAFPLGGGTGPFPRSGASGLGSGSGAAFPPALAPAR